MSFVKWAVCVIVLLQSVLAVASTDQQGKVLHVYGPGGPHHVLQECAELFTIKSGVEVAVIRALPHDLELRLPENGDIYYGGAEYMLEEFNQNNPDVLNLATAEKLHGRRIGIMVRKGNPLKIEGVAALRRPGVALLDVKLEKMRHLYAEADGLHSNVKRMEYTGRQGLSAWLDNPELDAWVTYKSWHSLIEEGADFIEIPGAEGLRHIPVALTHRTEYPQEAMAFVAFLKSEEAYQVFAAHGWE